MTQMPRFENALIRPRLLVEAARAGQTDYRRERDLRRIIGLAPRSPGTALPRLREMEAELDAMRRSRAAGYRAARHVEVMIALLAEAAVARP